MCKHTTKKTVTVAINWGTADVRVFPTPAAAARFFSGLGLRQFPNKAWADTIDDIEQGEYWSTTEAEAYDRKERSPDPAGVE